MARELGRIETRTERKLFYDSSNINEPYCRHPSAEIVGLRGCKRGRDRVPLRLPQSAVLIP